MKYISLLLLIFFSSIFLSACSQVSYQTVNRDMTHNRPVIHAPSQQAPTSQTRNTQQTPRLNNQQLTRQRMVQIATNSIGTRYRWGGNNPKQGFDCSGLMSYVHKNAMGKNIPRTAAQQRDNSRTISYAQLQPGDMLFFKTGKKTNHVGIYIGNRKFVHASTGSKRVKIASMDSKYWYKRFVKFGTYL